MAKSSKIFSSTQQETSDSNQNQNSHILYVRKIRPNTHRPGMGSSAFKTELKRIEAVQNLGLCAILADPNYVTNIILRATAGLPTVQEFILENTKTMFYKNSYSKYYHI